MRCCVLGAGRVGSAIASDLARLDGWEVAVVDAAEAALEPLSRLPRVSVTRADLARRDEVQRAVAGADIAVGAVPGPMGYATLKAVIEAGVNAVDISFFEEDPLTLDPLARERGVVAVVDAGIAPGFDNLVLGYLETVLERVDRFACYVGGLPTARHWPFEYRAVFSPIDVIAEYTRPARLVEGGRVVTREALTERELLDIPGVGTLEAFNTDGLRTLLKTVRVPHMKEKTLRFPGHAEIMRILRAAGYFDDQPLDVKGVRVRPIDVTARLLSSAWQLGPGEEDMTVMRVEVEGVLQGRRLLKRYDLIDRFDRATGTTSMARTTGYTCTGLARVVADGLYTEPGISPPELVGRAPGCFAFVVRHLEERGVRFTLTEEALQ
jgi:lysine 6-dehydrogenase